MNIVFHLTVGLVLLIVQTTLLPQTALVPAGYDLLIAYTVYLGLHRRVKEGLPVVLAFGIAVDGLSGGPVGLFLTTYAWLYWIARWVIRFIHPRNRLLNLLAVAFGVALEHLIYMSTTAMLGAGALIPAPPLRAAVIQLLLALGTGGLLLSLLDCLQRAFEGWLNAFLVREAG
jgi:hypothetical protein